MRELQLIYPENETTSNSQPGFLSAKTGTTNGFCRLFTGVRNSAFRRLRSINLKRQLRLMNLVKALAIKPFQITHQIHEGYASFF